MPGSTRCSTLPWLRGEADLAILVDSMVLGIAFFVVFAIIGAATTSSNLSTNNPQPLTAGRAVGAFVGILLLAFIPYLLYYGLLNGSKRAQTWGRWRSASSYATRARTGGPLGVWRGIGRYAITMLFYVVLLVPFVIDNLSPLWDRRRQAWHDHVVHSVVVERNP